MRSPARNTCLYASDLNDAEWALLAPLVPRSHPAGRRQTYPLRRIVDAVFYLLRTGAQWRLLPHEYPPRGAVFYHYAQWREDGTWEHVTQVLRESYRRTIGRNPQPTAAIIDSQSVKTTEMGGPRGYDGGKKIKGRKRHLLVDTQGNLLKNSVLPADIHDRAGAEILLSDLQYLFPAIKLVWADTAYRGLRDWLQKALGWRLSIPQHLSDVLPGAILAPLGIVVEDGTTRGILVGQQPPLCSGAQQIEDRIDDAP